MSIRIMAVAALFTFVLAGLIIILISFLHQLACEGQPINFRITPTDPQQIWGEQVVSQGFLAPRDGLNRLDLLFQTYQRRNTHQVFVHLLEIPSVADQPLTGSTRFDFTINAASIQDRVWHTFTFPPIPDSAGKNYLIMITSPESTPGNAITVGGIEWDVYAPGSAFLGPTPLRADIAFRTCYQMTLLEKLQVLSEQVTHDRPLFWDNIVFYWFSLSVYLLLLIAFFWKLTRLVDGGPNF